MLIQIRANTSFETVKDLLLFVYTHNNNETCFCKIKKTDRMPWTGARYKKEQKWCALATSLIDVINICTENLKCLLSFEKILSDYFIHIKGAFLSKSTSTMQRWWVSIVNFLRNMFFLWINKISPCNAFIVITSGGALWHFVCALECRIGYRPYSSCKNAIC